MYYKWETEKKVLLVYSQGFDQFLKEERGNIVLSDLMPYDLGSRGEYNPLENSMEDVEMRSFDDYFENEEEEDEEEQMSGRRRRRRRRRPTFDVLRFWRRAKKTVNENVVQPKLENIQRAKQGDPRAVASLALDAAGLGAGSLAKSLAIEGVQRAAGLV